MVQPNATEKIAIYVEKLGRLAAAAIRMQPDIVVTTVPNLQAVVAEAFALAAATPGTPAIVPPDVQLRYIESRLAWQEVIDIAISAGIDIEEEDKIIDIDIDMHLNRDKLN